MRKVLLLSLTLLTTTPLFSQSKRKVCIIIFKTANVKSHKANFVEKTLMAKIRQYKLFDIANKKRYYRYIKIKKMTGDYVEQDLSRRKKALEMARWLNSHYLVLGRLVKNSGEYNLKVVVIYSLTGSIIKSFSNTSKYIDKFNVTASHVLNTLYAYSKNR